MRIVLSALALTLLLTTLAWAQSDDPLVDVIDTIKDSVVSVNSRSITYGSVSAGLFGEGSRYQQILTGWSTGFIFDKQGYIITDSRSLEGAKLISVYLSDNTELEAEVIGMDEDYGIGVLKVNAEKPLRAVKLISGEYDQVKETYPYGQGDRVIAIGASGGLGGTVTTGIISAIRNIRNRSGTLIPNMIQTDAKINAGNEGGPLFNSRGELLGMNEIRTGLQGTTFFIPISLVKRIASELIANHEGKKPVKDYKVWHPWLGIKVYVGPVNPNLGAGLGVGDDLKMYMNIPDQYWNTGFLVDDVYPDSPCSEYGVMAKDYVFALTITDKDEKVKVPYWLIDDLEKLEVMVSTAEKGDIYTFQVLRDNNLLNVEVIIGQHPGAFAFFDADNLGFQYSYEYF